ncbi:MAG: 2-dehydro-3-deoxyphosphooctonate aldolase, partial [Pseudomonadota bacterium]
MELDPQDALVAVMIAVAAADEQMDDRELTWITNTVGLLPVFDGFDPQRIRPVSSLVAELFQEEEGLDQLIEIIRDALPER